MQEVVQALISEYGGSKLHKGSRLLRCKLGLIVGGGAGTHEDKAARRTELMKLQEMAASATDLQLAVAPALDG